MKKYYIDVKNNFISGTGNPIAVIFDHKLYLISAITVVQHKVVFSGGGIGTNYDHR